MKGKSPYPTVQQVHYVLEVSNRMETWSDVPTAEVRKPEDTQELDASSVAAMYVQDIGVCPEQPAEELSGCL